MTDKLKSLFTDYWPVFTVSGAVLVFIVGFLWNVSTDIALVQQDIGNIKESVKSLDEEQNALIRMLLARPQG